MVFQEMSARLGVAGEIGLGEAIRRRFDRPRVLYWFSALLVVAAIGFGNAAYEAGNLLGAASGMQLIAGGELSTWGAVIGVIASALLWTGNYRLLERVLVAMVVAMSIVFLITAAAVISQPGAVLAGAVVPVLPRGSDFVALGLVGTTIVPYNLFLHASSARERWRGPEHLPEARFDLVVSIALGGIVSMAILVTGAAKFGMPVNDPAQMAVLLEPLLGRWATVCFALGFFAAGMTSAITAPMAAAYAVSGVLGWVQDLRSPLVRLVWILVMLVGVACTLLEIRPVPAILFAQAANGLLLPAVAIFLLVVMNDRRLLKGAANGWIANVLGVIVVLITIALGAMTIWRVVQR
jgi:Mn2+/Fe2+ NRAMP family transporter